MNASAFDLPVEPGAIVAWLERQFVAEELATIVAELLAVHGDDGVESDALDQLLPPRRMQDVLEGGLGVLPFEVVRDFLQRPRLLLQLQARILEGGGKYWDAVERPQSMSSRLESTRRNLEALLRDPRSPRLATPAPPTTKSTFVVPWYRRPWAVSLATAAAMVLLGVVVWEWVVPRPSATPAPWGWNAPGVVDRSVPARAYLEGLASAAEEWGKVRASKPGDLADRLIAMRRGCSRLILGDHPALRPVDRDWLVERCKSWAGKLDRHLAALEEGQDLAKVQADADETVQKLVATLRERSRQL